MALALDCVRSVLHCSGITLHCCSYVMACMHAGEVGKKSRSAKFGHRTRIPFLLYFFRRKDFFFRGRKWRGFFSGGRFSCESVQNSKENFGEVGKKTSPKLSDGKINLSAETSSQENLPTEKNLFKTLARKFSDLSCSDDVVCAGKG